MKRRSNNWGKTNSQESASDAEELHSNSSEDGNQENGEDSSVDSEPKEKRRRSKGKSDASYEKKAVSPKKKTNRGRKAKESDSEDDPDEEETVIKKNTPKKKANRGKRTKESDSENDEQDDDEEEDEVEEDESPKKNSSKKPAKGRKSKSKDKAAEIENSENANDDEEDSGLNDEEAEYEVESVIDEKSIKGVRYYLIRWKGYGEESDTWEPASTLNCADALREYKKKKAASKSSGDKSKRGPKAKKTPEPEEIWDENEDFEVVRILDVHFKRDGKREFLVAWKGYSSKYDSWEPEENMSCKDMIEKFLIKCDQAKEANPKDLRVMRKATDRFTLTSDSKGRRLSKRNQGKQRVHYHDAE